MRRLSRPLLYLGTIAIVIGLGRYHAQFIGHYYFHSSQRLPWNLVYAALLCISAYGVGLPELNHRRSAWSGAIEAAVVAAVAISALQFVLGSLLLPRFVVFASVLLAVPWFVLCGAISAVGRSREEEHDRVCVVAVSDEQAALVRAMQQSALERPAAFVSCLAPDQARPSTPRSKPLIQAVLENRVTVIVLDRSAAMDHSIVEQAATLHESGLRVRSLSYFYDEWLGKLALGDLERMSLMFDLGELHRAHYGRTKRILDLVVGALGVALLAALTPFILVGNIVANRGPLLYCQPRVGRNGKPFTIVKFRTMREGEGAKEWTVDGDPRVTPFGRWLRKSHADELPQVVNILRGDLSVVGPRPEQPQYVAALRERIPFFDIRHLVRPGLTGWAQVKYPYGADELDAMEKLQYDFYYLRHQSLGLDIRILGRTIRSVAGRAGR